MSNIKTFEEAAEAFEKIDKLRVAVFVMLERLEKKIKADTEEIVFFDAAVRLLGILGTGDTKAPRTARELRELMEQRRIKELEEVREMRALRAYLTDVKNRLDRFAEELRKK